MKLTITMNDGTLSGRSYELESGFLTVGRGDNCSIRFDPLQERVASKQHAFIEAKPDGFYITDNNSTNGTIVNGATINAATKLNNGDAVQFGRNGSTATIVLDMPGASIPTAPSVKPEEVRQQEIERFNEVAKSAPVSISASVQNLGLGRVEPKAPASNTGLYIGLAVFGLLMIPVALIVIALMFLQLGPVAAVIATVIAFTPAALYILPLMGLDRYDPEPFWLLVIAFSWGALVAVLVSFIVNTVFAIIVAVGTHSEGLASVAPAVISAPLIEEGSKGTGLLILLIFFRRYFDDVLDGIVYGGVIALGFATVENVLYYGNGLNTAVMQYGMSPGALLSFSFLFALRGILSPFAHVTFTSMTGIGCGFSRESHNWFIRIAAPVFGYCCAVFLHACWNGMSIVVTILLAGLGMESTCSVIGLGGRNFSLCGFFAGYTFLEVPFFFIFLIFVFFIMRRQRKILREMLAIDVARGMITQDQLNTATSVFKSTSFVLGGIFSGKFLARSRFLRAVGKLGLSYWHIQRATKAHGQTASFQQNPILRDEVLKWKDKV